jgi:hypothetical protein
MQPLVRVFVRREARLTLRRERRGRDMALIATESGRERTFPFTSVARLARFQRDMESFLCRTGWSLAGAAPDNAGPSSAPAPELADDRGLRLTFADEEAAVPGRA